MKKPLMATSGGDLRLNGFYCCYLEKVFERTLSPRTRYPFAKNIFMVADTCIDVNVFAHALSFGAHGKNWKNVKELWKELFCVNRPNWTLVRLMHTARFRYPLYGL